MGSILAESALSEPGHDVYSVPRTACRSGSVPSVSRLACPPGEASLPSAWARAQSHNSVTNIVLRHSISRRSDFRLLSAELLVVFLQVSAFEFAAAARWSPKAGLPAAAQTEFSSHPATSMLRSQPAAASQPVVLKKTKQ